MSPRPSDAADIEQARRNAAAARARVQSTMGALKQRLNPRNIAADAREKVRETTGAISQKASGAVRKRPAATTAAAGIAALVLFRKPVGKLAKLLFRRRDKTEPTPQKDDGLIRAGAPPKPSVTPRIERAVKQSNKAALAEQE